MQLHAIALQLQLLEPIMGCCTVHPAAPLPSLQAQRYYQAAYAAAYNRAGICSTTRQTAERQRQHHTHPISQTCHALYCTHPMAERTPLHNS